MDIKKTKNIKILLSVVILIAAIGVAYALSFSKWKEIGNISIQISQKRLEIDAKKSDYAIIDSKIEALNNAKWVEKKDSILINFDESLFFTPKINNFFKNIVASSGMKLDGMTSSLPESAKAQPQTTNQTEEEGKDSTKAIETTVNQNSGYLGQLQGPVRKTTINLNVSGTYSKFKSLLSLFEGQTRIITIKSVTVSSAGQEAESKIAVNNLNFSVVLDVYSY